MWSGGNCQRVGETSYFSFQGHVMKAADYFEMRINSYQSTRRYILEDRVLLQ
jgi:hypothetical protein